MKYKINKKKLLTSKIAEQLVCVYDEVAHHDFCRICNSLEKTSAHQLFWQLNRKIDVHLYINNH